MVFIKDSKVASNILIINDFLADLFGFLVDNAR